MDREDDGALVGPCELDEGFDDVDGVVGIETCVQALATPLESR